MKNHLVCRQWQIYKYINYSIIHTIHTWYQFFLSHHVRVQLVGTWGQLAALWSLGSCPNSLDRIEKMAENTVVDPMDLVEPSEMGESSPVHPDIDRQAAIDDGQCDMGSGISLTAAGIRIALCRRERTRPLLRLVCKGCGMSTHDADIFVPGDSMEPLAFLKCGLDVRFCMSTEEHFDNSLQISNFKLQTTTTTTTTTTTATSVLDCVFVCCMKLLRQGSRP